MSRQRHCNFSRGCVDSDEELPSHLTYRNMYPESGDTLTPPLFVHHLHDMYGLSKAEALDSRLNTHHNLDITTGAFHSDGDHYRVNCVDDSLNLPYVVQPQSLCLYDGYGSNSFGGALNPDAVFDVPWNSRLPTSHPMTDFSLDPSAHEQDLTPFSSNSSDCFTDNIQDVYCSDDSCSERTERTSPTSHCPPEVSLADGDAPWDKPYARLIWEALMQAPDHKMMLREIYDWFLHNTNKPRESGTNGWQNSIRHNLSMNKAFENDKSDSTSARGNKKATSIWMLTEYAIRHGVESTTRFRKPTLGKKIVTSQRAAVQRQRSGAKGGRAARRAARLRKREETPNMQWTCEQPPMSMFSELAQTYGLPPTTQTSPLTSPLYQNVNASYTLPTNAFYQYEDGPPVGFERGVQCIQEKSPVHAFCQRLGQGDYSVTSQGFT